MTLLILKTIFWLTIIIGVVIFIHELGHYLAARIGGIKVEEFAFGFGKKVLGKKIGDTLYRINMIPMGGYVRLLGQEEESEKPESFTKKSFSAKLFVVVAGVIMNFFLAVVIFYVILGVRGQSIYLPRITNYAFWGSETTIQNKPIVENIIANTPASDVDFPKDVIIWEVEGKDVENISDVGQFLSEHRGEEIQIKLLTFEGNWITKSVTPAKTDQEGVLLGVEFYDVVGSFYKLDYSRNTLFSGFLHSVNFTGYTVDIFGELLSISVEEKSVKPVSEGVSGVVGVANRVFDLVRIGDIIEILNLVAGINLSLAIINMLPIPGLDGGYVLFMIIEKIRGRKLAERFQEWSVRIGFALLIIVGVLITVKDIIQYDIISRLSNWITSLF